NANTAVAVALCDGCGTVQKVVREKRKSHGGMSGAAGGAVAGGVIGNQVGSGTTNTVATVGGAVAGGLIGNEIQKK
ncbi:MAG: glycine zipper 2TM domain-containing protein, partial [Rhodoferax sp.]|nr:glycine zipper 2TM domain-containing protein [Rhodoferax sp.]